MDLSAPALSHFPLIINAPKQTRFFFLIISFILSYSSSAESKIW